MQGDRAIDLKEATKYNEYNAGNARRERVV